MKILNRIAFDAVSEVKKEMTDAYISNSIIRDIYGITGDADFDSVFSPVSIESTLFYIFAATAHVIEQMFDQFKTDVEERIDANIIPTVRWYHSSALAFQYGDPRSLTATYLTSCLASSIAEYRNWYFSGS